VEVLCETLGRAPYLTRQNFGERLLALFKTLLKLVSGVEVTIASGTTEAVVHGGVNATTRKIHME